MKEWKMPEVVTLDVKQTQGGGKVRVHDGAWVDIGEIVVGLGSPS